ncbi:enoyl-CoA delta isomerase 1, mitochondrial-like [Danaus plexippus]|uniref:enoyl-CoA delta isomerase 1, mitochondrial-like n=1 Tax=Danaus plexippus TaxID=13037 RepID=UPI002AB09E97|nr:enoyl-CoA delta isomerase 1, mitochondrial-like [Danaus plexippus]
MSVLRRVLCQNRWLPQTRALSTQGPLVDLKVDNAGVAVMTLQRPPVNSLNLDLLKEMSKSLDEIAKNKSKAMILTSASPKVFSAGLDIMEMYKPDLKRVEEFWTTLQEVWFKLFGSNFITAAAINGHAPAGGCLLAMCCEYRVMTGGNFSIGLNETALGIVAPNWFMDTMTNTIPVREAEYALTTARMFNVEEALKVGLIDEVATDKDDAIAKCKGFIGKFDRIPALARSITKLKMRQAAIKRLQDGRREDLNEFLQFVQNPKIQKSLEMYIQSLKKKA